MLKIINASQEFSQFDMPPRYHVVLMNQGDGAARDVRLTFAADVFATADGDSGRTIERRYSADDMFVTSYLKNDCEATAILSININSAVFIKPRTVSNTVVLASISYYDVFGARFETIYSINERNLFDGERFRWETPMELLSPPKRTTSLEEPIPYEVKRPDKKSR